MSEGPSKIRFLLLGGFFPILAFAVVEQFWGTLGGVLAGLVFGVGEVLFEMRKTGKVQGITLVSSGLVVFLGALSLWENDGLFFKLQPTVVLLLFGGTFVLTGLLRRPLLVALAKKQNRTLSPFLMQRFRKMNSRMGFLLIGIGVLNAWAAVKLSTSSRALLKTVGVPMIFGLYLLGELLSIRWSRPPNT